MIASVVATLREDAGRLKSTIDQLEARPEIELGEFQAESRRIPLTIEGGSRIDVAETTRWIQELPEVGFVDVVFVYLDEPDASGTTSQ